MHPADLLDFLADLNRHNERDWFQAHKATHDQLRAAFEQDVAHWLTALSRDEPALAGLDARKCVFRIYRDVRFSKNKLPYKTHFSAYFAAGGKAGTAPGRYVQVGPEGQTLVAAGLYEPSKEQLAAVRQELDYQAADLEQVLAAPAARRFFPQGLGGEQLKRMPPGYDPAHPHADWLRHKQFLVAYPLADAEVRGLSAAGFRAHVLAALQAAGPFCQWLARIRD